MEEGDIFKSARKKTRIIGTRWNHLLLVLALLAYTIRNMYTLAIATARTMRTSTYVDHDGHSDIFLLPQPETVLLRNIFVVQRCENYGKLTHFKLDTQNLVYFLQSLHTHGVSSIAHFELRART